MGRVKLFTFKQDFATVGTRDLVNDTDERGFSGAVGTQQAKTDLSGTPKETSFNAT
jgi:hypothetical protein